MYFDLTFLPIDKFVKKKKERKTSLNLLWNSDLLDFLSWTKHFNEFEMFRGGFIGGHLANSFFFSFFFLPIHYTLSYFVCKILPSLIYLFLSFSVEGGKENSTMFIIIFPLAAGGLLLALSGLIILRRMQKKRRDLKLQGISADCF